MRTIKFRGIDIETGQWLNGDLIQYKGHLPNIHFSYMSNDKLRYSQRVVKKETLGQFTGLLDKNGKEIYEGDIIAFVFKGKVVKSEVAWNEDAAMFVFKQQITHLFTSMFAPNFTVIGNIHDNPDLLNNTKEE